ncbi:MAG: cytochrome c [Acidobacteriia bacterium]|nr:cytochrome c [Terriglobia bacterium]
MKTLSFLFAVLALALVEGCLQVKAQSARADAGRSVENGKRLWMKDNCYTCHGTDGHGGGAGPKLAPHPMPVAAFIAIVRHPRPSSMPAFSAKLISDDDLRDMWAYLNTIPEDPAPANIPLLQGR